MRTFQDALGASAGRGEGCGTWRKGFRDRWVVRVWKGRLGAQAMSDKRGSILMPLENAMR
jgi:hypothetical protein